MSLLHTSAFLCRSLSFCSLFSTWKSVSSLYLCLFTRSIIQHEIFPKQAPERGPDETKHTAQGSFSLHFIRPSTTSYVNVLSLKSMSGPIPLTLNIDAP